MFSDSLFPSLGARFQSGPFLEHYKCYPMTALKQGSSGKDRIQYLNYCGKVILPPSALEILVEKHVSNPMIFKISNPKSQSCSHGGVLEFIAEEGRVYLPSWMMKSLKASEGDILTLESSFLSKGHFIKVQPQSMDFLDITDPRAVLENALRHFSALTLGDKIAIYYNDKIYELLVLETKPNSNAIEIHETDLEVDFAPPPGYEEPTKPMGRNEKSIVNKIDLFVWTNSINI